MKEEIVLRAVSDLSFGNPKMNEMFRLIYSVNRSVVDQWPDEATDLLSRKMIRATGCLIHRKIVTDEYIVKGRRYWGSDEGKKVDEALNNYIESRKLAPIQTRRTVKA